MKKLLLSIVVIATLVTSCTKQKNVSPNIIPPVDTTSDITKWNSTDHRYSIVYNNGAQYVLGDNGSYFVYKVNSYLVYSWVPMMPASSNKPNFSSSNFERGDTLKIDFNNHWETADTFSYTKIEVLLDGKTIAIDSGKKQIIIQAILK
jgi:hypothetical protein